MDLVLKVDELRDESLKHDDNGTFRLKEPFKVSWRDEVFKYVNMVWYDDDKEWVVGFFPNEKETISRDALFKTSDKNGIVVIKDAIIVGANTKMTVQLFDDIKQKISNLSIINPNNVEFSGNFEVDYLGKTIDFTRYEKKGDENGMIKSVCKMIILAIKADDNHFDEKLLSSFVLRDNNGFDSLVKPLHSKSSISLLFAWLEAKGYNAYMCVNETIKEVLSKAPIWDHNKKEWIEIVGAYSEEEARRVIMREEAYKVPTIYSCIVNDGRYEFSTDCGEKIVKKWHKANYDEYRLGL